MGTPVALRVTADEYRALPEGGPQYQLVEGELCMSPAPNRYHQKISGSIEFIFRKYLEDHPVGELYDAPFDVFLGEHNVFQPDIVFVSNSRLDILTDAGAEGAPNLVVEIMSPKTARMDKESKRKVYASAGVEELWLIDPDKKRIEIFHLQQDADAPKERWGEHDTFTSRCFPGLEIKAEEIFR